jgi:hypothetical protein
VKSERGSASLEFIAAGVLLLVPLIYLVLILGRVQAGTLAAESIARQAARVFVTASSLSVASDRIALAAQDGLADFHFVASDGSTSVSCLPAASRCLRAESIVTVTETINITLPFVPAILGLDKFARVTVSGHATQRVALGAGIP